MSSINHTGQFLCQTISWSGVNRRNPRVAVRSMQMEKPLGELYNVRMERKVPEERLNELGVSKWSMWKTGKCRLPWDWQVDQLVYIEEGEVRVVPEGSQRYMSSRPAIWSGIQSGSRQTCSSTGRTRSSIVSEPTATIRIAEDTEQ